MKKINLFAALKAKNAEVTDAEKKLLDEISEELNVSLDALKEGTMTNALFETKMAELVAKTTGLASKAITVEGSESPNLNEHLRKMGEEITALKTAQPSAPQNQSIRQQIEKWQKDNDVLIQKIKSGEKADLPTLVIKAAHTMTLAASANAPISYNLAQGAPLYDLIRNKPTFWNMLAKGRTNLPAFPWVNKTNKQGAAAFIGEGVAKPPASFDLSSEIATPKKVAESMKMSTELLYDVDGIETMVMDELRYEVEMAANTAVLTGTASSTVPAGVTTIAAAFTVTTIQTSNPTYADAIRSAIAQLRVSNFDTGIVAFINPIDGANMDLAKADDSGVYMLPPFTTADGRKIANVMIVEDNNIAVGHLLIGDMTKYKILMYQDFFIKFGWENDDFTKNLVTAIGEMRFYQYSSANWAGAFIYDTFANILAAIDSAI